VRSGRRRLRPILMTTLATALAMLPLAWGIGHGADLVRIV
jgi:multidrug efflux pump subunit AcrB